MQTNSDESWNILHGMNRYVFLTGDYRYNDGVMTYRAIENGEEIEIEYADKNMQAGFYQWKENQLGNVEQSVLLLKGASGGPQDGAYMDGKLNYEDQLLTLTQNKNSVSLGLIDPNIPVYQLSNEQYEVFPAKNISNVHGQIIVISLNKDGIRIIAIYVIQ